MTGLEFFHTFVMPVLLGLSLTIAKAAADQKLLSFDDANDVSLDLVLVAVGAMGVLFATGVRVDQLIDAGVGDAFLSAILLYFRVLKNKRAPRDGPFLGDGAVGYWCRCNHLDHESLLKYKMGLRYTTWNLLGFES